jgi:PAS domain S-box-containing protein
VNDGMLMHHHEPLLVALSILAAMVAGYAALDLTQRAMGSADPGMRRRLLTLAALTMGVGIWTMHFVGMLSLDLGVEVSYAPALVVVSIVPAVAGAAIALTVVTKPGAGRPSVILGAAFMGLAVAAMHYIGMAGLRLPARIDWSPLLVVLSIAIAYGASLLTLGLVHNLHAGRRWRRGPLLAAAVVFGVGVAGLHYVGMFAATFYAEPAGAGSGGGAGTELLAILLAVATALMLIVLLWGAGIDRRATARLAQADAQFAGAFEAAAIGMTLTGTDGRFLAVNAALCDLLQRDREELIACTFQELTHPDDLESDLVQFRRVFAGEIDSYQMSKRYLLPDGGIVWALLTVSVVRDADGRPLHFVSQVQDIADRVTAEGELKRYAEHLDALAAEDPLTGLRSAGGLMAAVAEEISVQNAGGPGCSVVTIAVEGGDSAMLAAAETLRDLARGEDVAARVGESELAVLLPGVGEADAEAVAGRLRRALPRAATFGVATARSGDDAGALLARARQGHAAAPAREGAPVPSQIDALLELVRRQLGTPISFLTRIEDETYVLERIAGERERFGLEEGTEMPFDGSHCARMLDGRIGSAVADLSELEETRDLAVTREFGLRAYAGVPVRLRSGEVFGTLCVVDTVPHPELSDRQVDLLGFVSELAGEAIDGAAAEEEERVAETSAIGVRALLVALEARDKYTGEHSREVVRLACRVAERLGLGERAVRDVEQVALLHDVGKVGIPDAILQKQGPLDEVEWEVMRKHPIVGERIIAGIPGLSHLAPAMRAEHERWDGGGYPDGLAGEAIPIASRITLACDAFHAMTSERPYRPAMAAADACAELRRNAGTQFDPTVAEALLAELGEREPGAGRREDVALSP